MKIGYARVSTNDQNYESQVEALEQAGCDKIFHEKISGKSKDRPELERMLEHLRQDDVVVVTKLDRLARSVKDLLSIMEELKNKDAGFVSLSEGMDLSTPQGRLQMNLFGAIAEFERELIVQRVKEGVAHAKSQGRVGGRPPALSNEEKRKLVNDIRSKRLTTKEALIVYGVSRATVNRALASAKE